MYYSTQNVKHRASSNCGTCFTMKCKMKYKGSIGLSSNGYTRRVIRIFNGGGGGGGRILNKEAGSGQRSIDHATRYEVACTRPLRGRVYLAGWSWWGVGVRSPQNILISAFLKRLEIVFKPP